MFPEQIETDRLRLERIAHDTVDVFALHEFYGGDGEDGERMFEYWDSRPHETPKETVDYVDEAERLWDEGEGAKYVVRPEGEVGAGAIAGTTGLYPDWEKRSANLGVVLDPRFWGRGYSGERADALLAVAFERLDLDVVVAAHVDGNERSRRAIEKYVDRYGGRYEGLLRNWHVLPDAVADVHRYTISKDEYRHAAESSDATDS